MAVSPATESYNNAIMLSFPVIQLIEFAIEKQRIFWALKMAWSVEQVPTPHSGYFLRAW